VHDIEAQGQGILGINYTYVSHAARTKVPGSSYSACIEDVYNGVVDFCAADFWCARGAAPRVGSVVSVGCERRACWGMRLASTGDDDDAP